MAPEEQINDIMEQLGCSRPFAQMVYLYIDRNYIRKK